MMSDSSPAATAARARTCAARNGSFDTYYEVQAWGNGRGGIDAEWERFHDAWKESYLKAASTTKGPGSTALGIRQPGNGGYRRARIPGWRRCARLWLSGLGMAVSRSREVGRHGGNGPHHGGGHHGNQNGGTAKHRR